MRRTCIAVTMCAAICFAAVAYGACPLITVGPRFLSDATLGQPYSQLLTQSGAAVPFTYAIVAGALPTGMRLNLDRIEGSPAKAGTYTFDIRLTDANGCTGQNTFSLKVIDPNGPSCTPLTTSPATLPPGAVGQLYSTKIVAIGGQPPYNYTIARGDFPPGLALSGNLITGFPSTAGVFSFDLGVLDAKQCGGQQHYDLQIVDAGCPTDAPIILSPADGASPDGTQPIAFSWTSIDGAISYELLASIDNGATYTTIATIPDPNTTAANVSLAKGTYLIVVRAIRGPSCSTRSAALRLNVGGTGSCPTVPPGLTAPQSGASNLPSSVTFQWTAVATATSYTIFTSANGAPFQLIGTTGDTTLTKIVPGGTIDWYVEAQFTNCTTLRSATNRFTVAQAQCGSGNVDLSSPANGTTTSSPVRFAWSALPGASAYRLWVGGDNVSPAIIARTSSTSTTQSIPSGAATWFVEALFDDCPSVFSGRGNFTVTRAATCSTEAATLVAPPRGSDTDSPVTLDWSAVTNAIGYRVWVGSAGQFVQAGFTTQTEMKLQLAPGTYSWYVDTLFSGCPAVSSQQSTFAINDNGAGCSGQAPSILAPVNNGTAASPATFSWTAAAGATQYRVFASLNGASLQLLGTTRDTTLKVSVPPGTISWFVEAAFKGCSSTRSSLSRFTLLRAASCPTEKPQIVSPTDGDSHVTSPVTLSWTPVSNALRYVVVARSRNGAATVLGETTATQLQRDIPAGTTEWYVIALGAGCDPLSSERSTFTVPIPPGCTTRRPHPLAPADDSINIASPVHFAWTKSPGAISYRLFAATNGEEPALVTTTTNTEVTVAMPAGAVRWSVQAVFDSCPSLFSALNDVTVASKPLTCGNLDRPVAHVVGQVLSGSEFNVRWTGVTNASAFEVEESTSADFSKPTTQTVSSVSATFNHTVSTPTVFYYRVRAVSSCSDDRSAFSKIVATRVIPPSTVAAKTRGTAEMGVQNNVVQTLTIPGSSTPTNFSATTDKPWLTVSPATGIVPPAGVTLTVTSDPRALNVGANHGTVRIAYSSPGGSTRIEPSATTPPTTIPISISLVTPVAPDTKASPPPDSLIVPAVAHAAGANGSQFQSDVRLANVSAQPQSYLINFTPTATDGTRTGTTTTIQVDPGQTAALDDLLSSFFGTAADGSAAGMLEIRPLTSTSTSTIFTAVPSTALTSVASSRTYNVTPQGTFGQFIPAIPFSQFVGKGSILSLQQIAQSSAYRTNFGLLEAAGEPASVVFHVFDKDGNSIADIPQSLLPSEHLALNGLLAANSITLDDGRVEVEVTSATGKVSAYASVIDNLSNDPLLVSPVLKSSVSTNRYVIPGVAYTNGIANWRSDVRLYNSGSASVNATLIFYPQGAPGSPQARTVNIAAGEVKGLDNILNRTFGITDPNAGGSILVTTNGPSSIIASARTYTPVDVGTVGQFIPAVTASDSIGNGDRSLQLLQLESSDAFRTNIGLVETTGNPAVAEVSLILPDSKVTPVISFTLAPNEFVQFPLSAFGLTESIYNARVSIRVVDGNGKVAAYGSLVDNLSKDPTYVPAQ
jgi:putative Ig domain-containing protein/BACON domain-containing protein